MKEHTQRLIEDAKKKGLLSEDALEKQIELAIEQAMLRTEALKSENLNILRDFFENKPHLAADALATLFAKESPKLALEIIKNEKDKKGGD